MGTEARLREVEDDTSGERALESLLMPRVHIASANERTRPHPTHLWAGISVGRRCLSRRNMDDALWLQVFHGPH